MLKTRYKVLISVLVFIFTLYVLPLFVNLNSQREYITDTIESTFGFRVKINGNISFTILPTPTILVRDVNISSKDETKSSEIFLNAERIFINVNPLNYFKKNLVIDTLTVIKATFYADNYKNTQYENFDSVINGKMFKDITIKNSKILFSDEKPPVDNINFHFKTGDDGRVNGTGSFIYNGGRLENVSIVYSFLDTHTYNVVADFDYITGKSKLKNRFNVSAKDGEHTFSGDIELSTSKFSEFILTFFPNFTLPDTSFWNDAVKLKFKIRNSADAILLSNGSIEASEVVGKFNATLPFTDVSVITGKPELDLNNVLVNIDFSSLQLAKFMNIKRDVFLNPISTIENAKTFLSLFRLAKFNITAKNIIFKKSMLTDFKLNTTPIRYDNNFNGINISNLSYNSSRNNVKFSGKILNLLSDDIVIDGNISTTIPQTIRNIFTKNITFNTLTANANIVKNSVRLTDIKTNIAGNELSGTFSAKFDETTGRTQYDINVLSNYLDLDKIVSDTVDLSFIISKLALIKSSDFSLNAIIKSLKLNKSKYDAFKLSTSFKDGSLQLKTLTFTHDGYQSRMNGELFNILSSDGEFRDFNYNISSKTLKGISIPFIRNTFIETMIANGVNKIDIHLNGPASNPISQVDARLGDISIKVNGKLLDNDASYTIELSHNELKGFLFSWGYISENLLGYFYDNIPFSIKANIDGYNIKDLDITIKNNHITGEILRDKISDGFETSVILNTGDFDLRSLIKRIKDTDGYVDFLLKLVRDLPYNLTFTANRVLEYNGNLYKDVKFDLHNSINPGYIKFSMTKGKYAIDLDSEILNTNMFDGTMKIQNYTLPNDLMSNDVLSLKKGTLDADVTFKTNGGTALQLISNLSGKYSVKISNGVLKGVGDYITILGNILNLANITVNNILYSIESSVKEGTLNFPSMTISGELDSGDVKDSVFQLIADNMDISGTIAGNLIQKSLKIESVFEVSGLSPDTITFMYNLNGFVNELTGKMDTTPSASKINPIYLQRKKKELSKQHLD